MRAVTNFIILLFLCGQAQSQAEDWFKNGEVLDQQQTASSRTFDNQGDVWQSFTPGHNGFLTKVMAYHYNTEESGTLYFYKGKGKTGELIYQQPYTASGTEFLTFEINDPFLVEKGNEYTMRFTRFRWFWKKADVYSGGEAGNYSSYDHMFKTFVKPTKLILDQAQVTNSNTHQGRNVWQSFTAGVDGYLNLVQAYHYSGTESGLLSIYKGENQTRELLHQQQYTANGTRYITFPLDSPVALQKGQKYTIGFSNFRWVFGKGDTYSGGISKFSANADHIFKTYVWPQEWFGVEGIWRAQSGRRGYMKISKEGNTLRSQYLLPPKTPIKPEEVEQRTWYDKNWSPPERYTQRTSDLNLYDGNRDFWKFTSANSAELENKNSGRVRVLPTPYKRLRGLTVPTYQVDGTFEAVTAQMSGNSPLVLIINKLTSGVELVMVDGMYRIQGKPMTFQASVNNTYLAKIKGSASGSTNSIRFISDDEVQVDIPGTLSGRFKRNDNLEEFGLRKDNRNLEAGVHFFGISNGRWQAMPKIEVQKRLGRGIPETGPGNRNEDWYYMYMVPDKGYRFQSKGLAQNKRGGPIWASIGYMPSGVKYATLTPGQRNSAESGQTNPAILEGGTFSPPYAGYFWIVVSTVDTPSRYGHSNTTGSYELGYIYYDQSDAPKFHVENWSFEKGLLGWTSTGTAFENQPTRGDNVLAQRILKDMAYDAGGIGGNYWQDIGYPIGHKGDYWIGTHENHPTNAPNTLGQTQGDEPVGTLTSSEFTVARRYCSFLIGGVDNGNGQRVEFYVKTGNNDWFNFAIASPGAKSEYMYREVIDLEDHSGKSMFIKIIDGAADGHINVDDFRFFDELPSYIEKTLGTTSSNIFKFDQDASVWGFADTHAHPTSHLGFGASTIIGDPSTSIEETYSTSLCGDKHTITGASEDNYALIAKIDPHWYKGGYPNFTSYPKFTSKTHQQQHIDFLKRAWEGGLRLYCALAVNNMTLAEKNNGGGKIDDEAVMKEELSLMKIIAATNNDWMEIAYTPKDARRIIHEGKLAVVLGVEVDNFGNFVGSSYDESKKKSPMVVLTENNAEELLDKKLDDYYVLGIRQVTPIHYISGVFGGAAVFNGATLLTQLTANHIINVESGLDKKIAFNLYDDWDEDTSLAAFFGPLWVKDNWYARIKPFNSDLVSMINADGLTLIGEKLMHKMMLRGMLIDSDHMGIKSKDRLFEIAESNSYPIMSSHTDAAALAFTWADATSSPKQFDDCGMEEKFEKFETTNIRKLAHEAQVLDEHFEEIRRLGGVVSPLLLPYRRKAYSGRFGKINNDCAGSSKTWAQIYLYSLHKMQGKGVALSSDRGMVDFIAPRFGVNAAFKLKKEELDKLKKTRRTNQRYAQKNGVSYAEPFSIYHPKLFENGDIEWFEEDAWKALAAWEAAEEGGAENPTDDGDFKGAVSGRVLNYLKGLYAENEEDLDTWSVGSGDACWEQAAMYCLKMGNQPSDLTIHDDGGKADTKTMYDKLLPIWELWSNMKGDNTPLRRHVSGNPDQTKSWKLHPSSEEDGIKHRDWDYNLDGLAHYGLIPDFLQDLRNIGMTPKQMTPLFRSAEDYIQMWEKAERAKQSYTTQK